VAGDVLTFDQSNHLRRGGEELGRVQDGPPGFGSLVAGGREYTIERRHSYGWRFLLNDSVNGSVVVALDPYWIWRGGKLRTDHGRLALRSPPIGTGRWRLAGPHGRISITNDPGWRPLGRNHDPAAAALHVLLPEDAMLTSDPRVTLTFACWLVVLWERTPVPVVTGGG
jgi:hypothetical protein